MHKVLTAQHIESVLYGMLCAGQEGLTVADYPDEYDVRCGLVYGLRTVCETTGDQSFPVSVPLWFSAHDGCPKLFGFPSEDNGDDVSGLNGDDDLIGEFTVTSHKTPSGREVPLVSAASSGKYPFPQGEGSSLAQRVRFGWERAITHYNRSVLALP